MLPPRPLQAGSAFAPERQVEPKPPVQVVSVFDRSPRAASPLSRAKAKDGSASGAAQHLGHKPQVPEGSGSAHVR